MCGSPRTGRDIADPRHDKYLQHLTTQQLRDMVGATAVSGLAPCVCALADLLRARGSMASQCRPIALQEDEQEANAWLLAQGAASVRTSALRDTVTAVHSAPPQATWLADGRCRALILQLETAPALVVAPDLPSRPGIFRRPSRRCSVFTDGTFGACRRTAACCRSSPQNPQSVRRTARCGSATVPTSCCRRATTTLARSTSSCAVITAPLAPRFPGASRRRRPGLIA